MEYPDINEIIERLSSSVSFAEKDGCDMDGASWVMQEGILLSYNEAMVVINEIKNLKAIVTHLMK